MLFSIACYEKKYFLRYNKFMKDKNINRYKAKNVLALLGLLISLFFAYVAFYGWQNNYDRKNVLITFFFSSSIGILVGHGGVEMF